ncbi:MAG TPA: acylphosphatase [Rhizomicrobium sp.]|jgi:acylphosphatase
MAADLTALKLRIEGVVQGVGFRAFLIQEARSLGLDGWVRNRSDGTVEALVSGDTKQVEAIVAACMRGPSGARVANIDMQNAEPPAEPGFRHRATV